MRVFNRGLLANGAVLGLPNLAVGSLAPQARQSKENRSLCEKSLSGKCAGQARLEPARNFTGLAENADPIHSCDRPLLVDRLW